MDKWKDDNETDPLDLIQWVLPKVQGNHVLDINCGAGLLDTYLARKGHQVLAIDPRSDLIEAAKNRLSQESDTTRQRLTYKTGHFSADIANHKYSTIFIHFESENFPLLPQILEEIVASICDSGVVIGFIPFDTSTYFKKDLMNSPIDVFSEISRIVNILEIRYFGKVFAFSGIRKPNVVSDEGVIKTSIMKNIERFYFEKTQQYVQTIDQSSLIIDRLRKKEAQNNLLAHNNNKILEQLNNISTSLSKQQLISENQQKQIAILKDLITEQESLTRLIDILAMEILRLKNELHALRQGKTKTAQRKTLSVRQEGIIRKAFRYYRVHGFKKTVKRVLLEFGRK